MTKRLLTLSIATLLCSAPLHAEDLMEAYALARASDPLLLATDSSRKSIAEGVPQARSALLPSLTATAGYTKNDIESIGTDSVPQSDGTVRFEESITKRDLGQRDLTLNVRQTIYDRANYTRLDSARALADRAEADYEAAVDNLSVRVAEAYFAVLTATDSLAFSKSEETAVGRQLEQAEQRFNVGLTAITDVHEARARHDSAVAAVILAENGLDDAQVALGEITGTFIESVASLQEELPLNRPEPAVWQDWVELALKNNPAIRSSELAAQAADYNIDTARAAYFPTLALTGRYNDGRSYGETLFDGFPIPAEGSSDGYTVGVTFTVPLDVSGLTQSRIRQSVYDHQGSLDNLEQQRRSITRQTRNAYRAVIAGISEVQARKQAVISAQSALEATEAGFEVGTRTIVDVLLSQQILFQAQRDYSNSRHNFILNGLRLKRAAGVVEVADLQQINTLLRK
jgi:outer membrane protein